MRFKRKNIARLVLASIIVVLLVKVLIRARKSNASRYNEVASQHNDRYEKWIHKHSSSVVQSNGELGKPVYLAEDEKENARKIYSKMAINVLVSDKIPLQRKLRDVRNPLCANTVYDLTLPTTSIVIIFYNEAWSVLLRTVHSVLNETSPDHLKEIILVDDHSDEEDLKDLLDYYVQTRLPNNVRLLRLSERQGLIKARLEGAKIANGDVLLFLDAHCEVTKGWLPPLLQRIKENRNSVAIPIIDIISEETLEYQRTGDDTSFLIGGFAWSGEFVWMEMQESEVRSRTSSIAPVKTPTMAGGLFAIDRKYFWEVGSYDDNMEGWGGENLEMSFRIWQCGGSLEIIPCSRVGHVFRRFFPYEFPSKKDTYRINTARLAHVWMDEYKRLFFLHHHDLKENMTVIGDVSERLKLREKLQCKSFKWYLQNIYPEKFVPDENVQVFGRARLKDRNLCLDSLHHDVDKPYNLSVNKCDDRLTPRQYFSLTESETLRKEDMCATVLKDTFIVSMVACGKYTDYKRWQLREDGTIVHVQSGRCLDATGLIDKEYLVATECYKTPGQFWKFDYSGNDIPLE